MVKIPWECQKKDQTWLSCKNYINSDDIDENNSVHVRETKYTDIVRNHCLQHWSALTIISPSIIKFWFFRLFYVLIIMQVISTRSTFAVKSEPQNGNYTFQCRHVIFDIKINTYFLLYRHYVYSNIIHFRTSNSWLH